MSLSRRALVVRLESSGDPDRPLRVAFVDPISGDVLGGHDQGDPRQVLQAGRKLMPAENVAAWAQSTGRELFQLLFPGEQIHWFEELLPSDEGPVALLIIQVAKDQTHLHLLAWELMIGPRPGCRFLVVRSWDGKFLDGPPHPVRADVDMVRHVGDGSQTQAADAEQKTIVEGLAGLAETRLHQDLNEYLASNPVRPRLVHFAWGDALKSPMYRRPELSPWYYFHFWLSAKATGPARFTLSHLVMVQSLFEQKRAEQVIFDFEPACERGFSQRIYALLGLGKSWSEAAWLARSGLLAEMARGGWQANLPMIWTRGLSDWSLTTDFVPPIEAKVTATPVTETQTSLSLAPTVSEMELPRRPLPETGWSRATHALQGALIAMTLAVLWFWVVVSFYALQKEPLNGYVDADQRVTVIPGWFELTPPILPGLLMPALMPGATEKEQSKAMIQQLMQFLFCMDSLRAFVSWWTVTVAIWLAMESVSRVVRRAGIADLLALGAALGLVALYYLFGELPMPAILRFGIYLAMLILVTCGCRRPLLGMIFLFAAVIVGELRVPSFALDATSANLIWMPCYFSLVGVCFVVMRTRIPSRG